MHDRRPICHPDSPMRMTRLKLKKAILGAVLVTSGWPWLEGLDIERMLSSMKGHYQQVNDYQAVLKTIERIDSRLSQEGITLLRFRKPFDVYLEWIVGPFAGRQVVYLKDRNPTEFYFRAESWLKRIFAPEKFDIRSPRALKNQHQTISNIGIGNLIDFMLKELSKGKQDPEFRLWTKEDSVIEGRPVWVIEGTFPNQRPRSYTVEEGDTIWSIAERFEIHPYVIVHNNDNVRDFFDLEEGKRLRIPKYYAYRVEAAVDKESRLPLRIQAFDWSDELYESYSYTNVRLNPGFGDEDFLLR